MESRISKGGKGQGPVRFSLPVIDGKALAPHGLLSSSRKMRVLCDRESRGSFLSSGHFFATIWRCRALSNTILAIPLWK
jgi:hypothetical protein